MSQLYGRARVFGPSGAEFAAAAVTMPSAATWPPTNTAHKVSGVDLAHNVDRIPFMDPNSGEMLGVATHNERFELTVNLIPVAASGGNTLANAKAALAMLEPQSKVSLSSFGGDIDGDYNYEGGGSIRTAENQYVLAGIRLTRYPDGASATTLSTLVAES